METEEINKLYIEAGELFAKGEFVEALKIYYRLLSNDINNSANYYNAGCACGALGDIELAVAFYKRAIRLDETNIRAINNLASIYVYNIKDFGIAIQYLDYVIKIAPNDAEAFNIYGNIYLSKKDYKKAQMYFRKAIQFDENYFKNHYDMACALIGLEKNIAAKEALEKCLKIYPNYEPALELLKTI